MRGGGRGKKRSRGALASNAHNETGVDQASSALSIQGLASVALVPGTPTTSSGPAQVDVGAGQVRWPVGRPEGPTRLVALASKPRAGRKLASLMFEHDVGVSWAGTYEVPRIDGHYFDGA